MPVPSLATSGLSVMLGGRCIVANVDIGFGGGSLTGILGPNGAGKSTFVRALMGVLPATGGIRLDGVDLAALKPAEIARRIAYLPQGAVVHWPLSVERLVALGRLPHLAPFSRISPSDQAAIDRAMAAAEVAHLADRPVLDLSGGERARALLARALAVEAPILVVDEPLASLDPAHQLHGMEILRARADAGDLVVAVLHDLSLAARYCDRVVVMDGGRIVADGAPSAILTDDLLAHVYRIEVTRGPASDRFIVPRTRLG